MPSESSFSRAFDEFAEARLAERVHEALVKGHLGDELIGHISRDGTAIEARERPVQSKTAAERGNARLKDEFGGNTIMIKGAPKVMNHLMSGVPALSADQLMRLRQ